MKKRTRNLGLVAFVLLAFLVGALVRATVDDVPAMTVPISGTPTTSTGGVTTIATETTTIATGSTTPKTTTTTTEQTIPYTMPSPTTAGEEYQIQVDDSTFYRSVIPWSAYSTAPVREMDIPQIGYKGAEFCHVDGERNLYTVSRANPETPAELGVFNLENGTYRTIGVASSIPFTVFFLAENDRYIVWKEGLQDERFESGNPVIHVYVRGTGEDITFNSLRVDSIHEGTRILGSRSPVLVLDDAVYISVDVDAGDKLSYQDLYRFDLTTRKLELAVTHATRPFVYNGGLAWYHLDYFLGIATPTSASGVIAGIPVLPRSAADNVTITGDLVISHKTRDSSENYMIKDGSMTLLSVKCYTYDKPPENLCTNGDLLAFSISWAEGWPFLYDIGRSALVDLTEPMGHAQFLGFSGNRLYFYSEPEVPSNADLAGTIGWIDLGEAG